jgi:two-component system, NtrC family, sensor histidine kinase HydH
VEVTEADLAIEADRVLDRRGVLPTGAIEIEIETGATAAIGAARAVLDVPDADFEPDLGSWLSKPGWARP